MFRLLSQLEGQALDSQSSIEVLQVCILYRLARAGENPDSRPVDRFWPSNYTFRRW